MSITRKTSKGLPRYDDTIDSDVLILSGAADVIPLRAAAHGTWVPVSSTTILGATSYAAEGYHPQVESGVARIERCKQTVMRDVHCPTISQGNVTSFHGQDATSRIADPEGSLACLQLVARLQLRVHGGGRHRRGGRCERCARRPDAADLQPARVGDANGLVAASVGGYQTARLPPLLGYRPFAIDDTQQIAGAKNLQKLIVVTTPWTARPASLSTSVPRRANSEHRVLDRPRSVIDRENDQGMWTSAEVELVLPAAGWWHLRAPVETTTSTDLVAAFRSLPRADVTGLAAWKVPPQLVLMR